MVTITAIIDTGFCDWQAGILRMGDEGIRISMGGLADLRIRICDGAGSRWQVRMGSHP